MCRDVSDLENESEMTRHERDLMQPLYRSLYQELSKETQTILYNEQAHQHNGQPQAREVQGRAQSKLRSRKSN